MNVIAAEFAKRCDKASKALESEEDNTTTRGEDVVDAEASDTSNNEVTIKDGKVPMGKHYMVFIATTWSSEGRPFAFIAARYCLSSCQALDQSQQATDYMCTCTVWVCC